MPARLAYYYFLAVGAISLGVVFFHPPHPHFWIWTYAAKNLFAGQLPEALITDPSRFGRAWLYPPYAALLFAPFLGFSLAWGQALYLVLSTAVFLGGLLRALRALRKPLGEDAAPYAGLGLFFLVATSDLTGAIVPIRLELLSVGALLWTLAWLVEGRLPFAAGALLGVAASWKLQLVSAMGLTAIASLALPSSYRKRYLAGLVAGALAMPALFSAMFPAPFVADCYRVWAENMRNCAEATWKGYQSFWSFTQAQWSWPADAAAVARLGLIAGTAFAAFVAWHTWRRGRAAIPVAMALGAVYPVLFSPLSQGAGYLLGLPVLLLIAEERLRSVGAARVGWTIALLGHWFVSSLVYSDVVPRSWKHIAFGLHSRPLGFAVLTAALLAVTWLHEPRRVLETQNA